MWNCSKPILWQMASSVAKVLFRQLQFKPAGSGPLMSDLEFRGLATAAELTLHTATVALIKILRTRPPTPLQPEHFGLELYAELHHAFDKAFAKHQGLCCVGRD